LEAPPTSQLLEYGDAEVLQEILQRYTAIGKREGIGPAYRVGLDVVDEVFGIEEADVLRAGEIAQNRAWLTARAAVHVAVMEPHGIRSNLSFDQRCQRCSQRCRLQSALK
jgi:predicted nucleic acid-binding protein